MPDYQLGQIYMIEPICEHEESERYYGSTIQKKLSVRFAGHTQNYKSWKNGKRRFVSSFSLFEKYGVENCRILLIENFPCNSKYELEAREAHFIRSFDCLNKNIPTRTYKQYCDDNAEKIKDNHKRYRENNMERLKEWNKQYFKDNADKKKEYMQKYYKDNTDKFKEYRKQYWKMNSEKFKEYRQRKKLEKQQQLLTQLSSV